MNKPSLDQLRIDRKPDKERSNILWILGVPLLLAAGAAAWYFLGNAGGAIEVSTSRVLEPSQQQSATVLNASGYVTARRRATVSSKFTGKVTEVLIEEGMEVDTGQVLARLDDVNIRASYELAAAQLVSAQRNQDETGALLKEAQRNFERSLKLVEKKLASESELDRSRALAHSLAAQLERKKADVLVAERQLDIYRQQLEDTIIRAPFAGVIVAKNAQPGEMISPVSAGGGFTRTGIGTIVDMSSLEIEIDVNEAYINRVIANQAVVATLDAYPEWTIPCHVIAIIPTADRQRATVEVRVGFDQLDSRILPDMGVKVAFQEADEAPGAGTTVRGVSIPATALRSIDGKNYVFVVSEGLAERRAITIGDRKGDRIMVVSGLAAGEFVVTDTPAGLADGVEVQEPGK